MRRQQKKIRQTLYIHTYKHYCNTLEVLGVKRFLSGRLAGYIREKCRTRFRRRSALLNLRWRSGKVTLSLVLAGNYALIRLQCSSVKQRFTVRSGSAHATHSHIINTFSILSIFL